MGPNRASKHTSKPCQQAYKQTVPASIQASVPASTQADRPAFQMSRGSDYARCLGSGRGHGDYGIGGRRRVSFGVPSDAGMEGLQRPRHDRAQRRKILIMGPSAAGMTGPQLQVGPQRSLNSWRAKEMRL